jgi:hypothetical protein
LWLSGVLGIALVVTGAAARAAGDPAASPVDTTVRPFGGQRHFGLGPAIGLHSGMGGLLTIEAKPLGLVVSGGYMPLLVGGNEGEQRKAKIDYYGSAQLNADLLIGPIYEGVKVDIDVLGGYRYNTVLGHGAGLGLRLSLDVSRALRVAFHVTPNVFPKAADRLDARGYPPERDALFPWFQGGVGVAAVFYP